MNTQIFDYGMNGEGVGKIDNIITLVPNCLKDELVDVEIIKDNKNLKFAKLKEIITPSKNRIEPKCPYFYDCGGCQLQHMNYDEQLNFKQLLVKKTIKKICNIDNNVNKTVACNNMFNYRNKASFNYSNNKSGFFKENSNEIVEISECAICQNNLNLIHTLFNNFLKSEGISEFIKHLVIREINNQILVGVVAKKELDLSTFYQILSGKFSKIGLYLIINNRKDSVVLSGKFIHVAGIKEICIQNFGLNYSVDLFGFHQTNIDVQNKIYTKVLDHINENSTVINGFSGQGLLSAIIATKAKHVYGIEINENSHISAEKLKEENNITNLTNHLGDFNKIYPKLIKKADTLILDPSKKGCGKDVMNGIVGVENLIYISCNPIALSKDINQIKEHYNFVEITPFDMFPNTNNVETLVIFKLKNKN